VKKSTILRLISLAMLVVATIFIACALANPALGRTFYIGNIKIGVEVWRAFYAIYAVAMIGLFVASFFVDGSKGGVKAGLLKLLLFLPVLAVSFVMGIVLVLEFRWWILLAFLAFINGVGYGLYHLFRKIDKKFGGA